MLRVTIMSFIVLCSKQGILTPGFTIDAEHVDKTYKNNPDVQPGPEPNKSNDEKPSGEMVKVETLVQTAPLLIMALGVCYGMLLLKRKSINCMSFYSMKWVSPLVIMEITFQCESQH